MGSKRKVFLHDRMGAPPERAKVDGTGQLTALRRDPLGERPRAR